MLKKVCLSAPSYNVNPKVKEIEGRIQDFWKGGSRNIMYKSVCVFFVWVGGGGNRHADFLICLKYLMKMK